MAFKYDEPINGKMKITESRGDKTPINIAVNKDPGNYYRRKAKMDAQNDMSTEPYDPKEGKKRGKKLLDKLINLDGV